MKTYLMQLSVLIALTIQTHAGQLRLPGSNQTRNAGQTVSFVVQSSNFTPGKPNYATVSFVNSKTWVSTPQVDVEIPANGFTTVNIPLPWDCWDIGTFKVKVQSGSAVQTSTWTLRIRSAVIWPYGGTVWHPGQAAAITWVTDAYIIGDLLECSMWDEDGGAIYSLGYDIDPHSGRFDFVLPPDVEPGTTYRIYLDSYLLIPMNDEYGDFFWPDLSTSTHSEKITIQ